MSITIRCAGCSEEIDVRTESKRDGSSVLVSLKVADFEAHASECTGGAA